MSETSEFHMRRCQFCTDYYDPVNNDAPPGFCSPECSTDELIRNYVAIYQGVCTKPLYAKRDTDQPDLFPLHRSWS